MKSHFTNIHKISTSRKASIPFECSECRSLFWYFPNFKRHALTNHSVRAHENNNAEAIEGSGTDRACPLDPIEAVPIIHNPYFFEDEDSISIDKMASLVTDLVTELRCDVSLPEKKVQVFIENFSSLLNWTQRYTMSVIKSFINAKQLSLEDNDTIEMLNALHIPNVTTGVKTYQSNILQLETKAKCIIPQPSEIVLGKTKTIHRVLLHPARGKTYQNMVKRRQFSKKIKIKKDVCHYISIIDTLRLVMTNPEAREAIENEVPQSDETIRSFKDGRQFSLHAFLNDYPCTVRLSLHIDEGEYANPLGSRKGNNKLTNVCMKVQNIDARINSSLERIYISLMVKSSVLKKYGYKKVFQPLIEDLLKLESEEGVKIKTDSG